MNRIYLVVGLALLSVGCEQQVTFCVQYVNISDIQIAFQAVDNKNTKLDGSTVSLPPPADINSSFASDVYTLTGYPPIEFSAPNQTTSSCTFTPTAGHIYRVEAMRDASFECSDDGTDDCSGSARQRIPDIKQPADLFNMLPGF